MSQKKNDKLKRFRIQAGLEQHEVEKMLGLSSGCVSRWENNGNLPKIKNLRRLAAIYNQPLVEIVKALEDADDEVIK